VLVGVIVLGSAAGAAFVAYRLHQSRNIVGSSTVEFTTTTAPPPKPPPRSALDGVVWPTYGFDNTRTREAPFSLPPPYRTVWVWHGQALLEFPPAIAYRRLFLTTFDGRFVAIDRATGKAMYRWSSGRCGWGSPAVSGGLVFATFIGRRATCNDDTPGTDGELVAFAAHSRRPVIRWRAHVGPTESSPLVAAGLVVIGDWNGRISAFDVRTGKRRWSFLTEGRVKGSVAASGGIAYIGSYDGHLYALDLATGKLRWRASVQPRLGSQGRFYATPAVAYGRVFIGSTDGKEYSYGARTGDLIWSRGTGSYVYSSAAVADGLVLVGSYDHSFYALDAATGEVRWRFAADGPISGSATVLGNIVFFSTFARSTYALDLRTGRRIWRFPDGKYSPIVSDGERIYLVGYGKLYALDPTRTSDSPRASSGR